MKNKYKLGQKVYAVKRVDWNDEAVYILYQDIVAVVQVKGGYKYELDGYTYTEDLVTDKKENIKKIIQAIIKKKEKAILGKVDNDKLIIEIDKEIYC